MTAVTDPFARTSAKKAHQRATEALTEATDTRRFVRDLVGERPAGHIGRCCLCGEQAFGRYCHAHRWAA